MSCHLNVCHVSCHDVLFSARQQPFIVGVYTGTPVTLTSSTGFNLVYTQVQDIEIRASFTLTLLTIYSCLAEGNVEMETCLLIKYRQDLLEYFIFKIYINIDDRTHIDYIK